MNTNTLNITAASILAVSNAIKGTGPRVDRETYKAHVPSHVSKKGEINQIFGSTLKTPANAEANAEAAFHNAFNKKDATACRQIIDDANRMELMAAFTCEGYLSQEFRKEMNGGQSIERLQFLLSINPGLVRISNDEYMSRDESGWEASLVKHLAKSPEVKALFA